MKITMKELLTEWRKETETAKKVNQEKKVISEGAMGQLWYECMDALQAMAMDNGYVCCLCASKAIEQCGQGPADMELCLQLIQDCCDDGLLSPQRHLKHGNCMIYVAID